MSFAAMQEHVAVLERARLVRKERRGRERLVRGDVDTIRATGTSRSAVSRRFAAATETALAGMLAAPLDELDLGTMALRWCAAGMIPADKQFRRVNGHLHLPALATRSSATSPKLSEPPLTMRP
jgi:DNA-binding transcriptional ArsR family regulator